MKLKCLKALLNSITNAFIVYPFKICNKLNPWELSRPFMFENMLNLFYFIFFLGRFYKRCIVKLFTTNGVRVK